MKQLHKPAVGADEDEDIAVLHLTFHLFMHHPAQRTDALAHVRPAGTQEVAHRVVQVKHGLQVKHGHPADFGSTLPSTVALSRFQSGHGVRWETTRPRRKEPVHPRTILLLAV